jgi:hypothetical protein
LTVIPRRPNSLCDHVRHRLDRAFRRVVDAVAGEHRAGRRARDVDDPPAVSHAFERELAAVERTLHVEFEAPVEIVLGDLAERLDERDPSVVDENVPAAETSHRRGHQRLELRAAADVRALYRSIDHGHATPSTGAVDS